MKHASPGSSDRIVLFANTDWYLYNFRRSQANALQASGAKVVMLSPDTGYGSALLKLGFDWRPAAMDRGSLNPFRELALLFRLWRFFRRERPTLVHGFTIKCAVYGAIVSRFAGVPCQVAAVAGMGFVFTSHSAKARLLRPVVRALLRIALGGARVRLVLQNPDDVALFKDAGIIDPARIRLIEGSGVDCVRFASARRERSDANVPRVLLASRLLWDKGLAEYAAAARQLLGDGRRVDFILAGRPDIGNPASVPEAAVRAWVEEGLMQWLGHVDDMPALLESVDIMVLPSYREGFPKSLIEGAASSLPMVATDVPGCRDVVSHERDGLLVPVRDAPALADAIARLLDDPPLAARLGRAAREKAVAHFDERAVIARTLSVYAELLG